LASVLGTFGKPKVMAVAVNTVSFNEKDALAYIDKLESTLKIPVTDVVRFGVEKIVAGWL
jgi:uncharacterized NAD-dependent epimerase/dehydratase family protein